MNTDKREEEDEEKAGGPDVSKTERIKGEEQKRVKDRGIEL